MRTGAGPTALAWSVAAASAACCAIGLWSFAQVPIDQVGGPTRFWPQVTSSLGMLAYAGLGGLIAARRPAHPIGWLFLGAGFAYQLYTLAGGVTTAFWWAGVQPPEPMWSLLLWLFPLWSVSASVLPVIMLLFPDGHLPSPRWRVGVWLTVVALVVSVISVDGAFGPLLIGPRMLYAILGPDLGQPVAYALSLTVSPIVLLAALAFGVAALIVRLRRARGDALLQLKWFVFAAGVLLTVITTETVLSAIPQLGLVGPDIPYPAAILFGVPWALSLAALPASAGIAILRYRLYDIDLLINRTLVYGALTLCVVAIYVLVVGYLGLLFQASGSTLVSLFATGLVAIVFQPLRERMQRGVNHLLYGQRDEPYAVLSRLGQRLGASLPPEAVLPTITQTVAEALKLPYTALAFEHDGTLEIAAAVGVPGGEPVRLPLIYQGATVGALLLGPRLPGEQFSTADRRLLDDLAHQAGIAVHAVALTAELQRSRERLVLAREEERRRIRRDLHDGLGPVLASLCQRLDSAAGLVERDPEAASALLSGLREQVTLTLRDIRRLVYALRPPALDEFGLVGAIRDEAAQHDAADGLRIDVTAPDTLPPLPAGVEVAAFRIATEALTNVVRHAHAQTCHIRLDISDSVQLEVIDDGIGLPQLPRSGVGMAAMRERAAELGGTCLVESCTGSGTRVIARLPVPKQ